MVLKVQKLYYTSKVLLHKSKKSFKTIEYSYVLYRTLKVLEISHFWNF